MNHAILSYLAALLLGQPSQPAMTPFATASASENTPAMAFVIDVGITQGGSDFTHHFMVLDGDAASVVVNAEKGSVARTVEVKPRILARGFQVDVTAAVGRTRVTGGIVLPAVGVAGEITHDGMGVEVTVRALEPTRDP